MKLGVTINGSRHEPVGQPPAILDRVDVRDAAVDALGLFGGQRQSPAQSVLLPVHIISPLTYVRLCEQSHFLESYLRE